MDPAHITDPEVHDEDELAELLLAAAVDDLGQPDTGDPTTDPDMGDQMTQPTQPPAPAGAPTTHTVPASANPPGAAAPAGATAPGAPQFVAPTPGAVPPAAPAGTPAPSPAAGAGDDGYPANTPVAEMNAGQQAAYWKSMARKHEQRVKEMGDYDQLKATAASYDALVAASQTEQERAVAEARRQGQTEGQAQALKQAGGQLVEQWVRAAAIGRLSDEAVNGLLLGLDRSAFLNQAGAVDTDRVYALVSSLAPPAASAAPGAGAPAGQQPPQSTPGQPAAGTQQPTPAPVVAAPTGSPDFGQGQPTVTKANGLAAGREIAKQRFAATPV